MTIRLDKVVQNKIAEEFGVLLSRNYIFKLLEMGAVRYSNEVIKKKGFKFSTEQEAQKIEINKDMVKAVIKEYKTGIMSSKYSQMWNSSAPIGMFDLRKEVIAKTHVSKDDIIYEDENFIAMYKPPGIVSHPSGRDLTEDSMIFRFLKYMKQVYDYMPRAGLLHRLDRETQGILLFAKNMDAYNRVKAQFASNQVIKLYLVYYYIPKPMPGRARPIVNLLSAKKKDVLENSGKEFFDRIFNLQSVFLKGYISMFRFKYKASFVYQKKELKKRIFKQIKEASSYEYPLYRAQKHINTINTDTGISIVQLVTGRTHQIRAQHEYLGIPIMGDKLYTPNKLWPSIARAFPYKNTIGLASIGLSFYDINNTSKRIYIKLPLEKVSFYNELA